MHPLLANMRALGLYALGWLFPAALLTYTLTVSGAAPPAGAAVVTATACLFYASVCLTPWYLCRYLPPRKAAPLHIMLAHLRAAAVAAGLFVLVANGSASFWSAVFPNLGLRIARAWPLLFGMGMFFYLLSSAVHYVILAVEQTREAETRAVHALVEAREAELRALKAQLSPHFLFNSLNSISALAGVDPARARQMCVQLADYFRATLGMGAAESVPLARELEMVRNYLEIERVRFSGRLRLEEAVEAGCEHCPVPALLLQPLAENAVKHGISNLLEGGVIRVEARHAAGVLELVIENSFDAASPPPIRIGVGLALVRKRLAARYGDGATLETGAEGSIFRARLRLPCA